MSRRKSPITQLGYVGLSVVDLQAWKRFAGELGMQVVEADSGGIRVRLDERPFRMFATQGASDALACIGLEVADAASLQALTDRLSRASVVIHVATPSECRARSVESMVWLTDPDDNRIELFHGLQPCASPFVPIGPIGGFRTGELGLGHIVLQTPRFGPMGDFYQELGLRTSDFMDAPFEAKFMHTNARHHSLALLKAPEAKVHHIMVEYLHLDDIGRLYDAALLEPDRVVSTLGRHSNDHMLSFYSRTPSGFMMETGWAGRLIDVDTWEEERIVSPSLWGHERKWLPEAARQAIRQEMDNLAALGVRAPVEVADSPAFSLAAISSSAAKKPLSSI